MKAFIVWCPDDGDTKEDGRVVHAVTAAQACELWAERDDCESAEYGIANGKDALVVVELPSGKTDTYRVTAETKPNYYAIPSA